MTRVCNKQRGKLQSISVLKEVDFNSFTWNHSSRNVDSEGSERQTHQNLHVANKPQNMVSHREIGEKI